MIPVTLSDVASAVGGRLSGDGRIEVTGAAVDSRRVAPGDLFVAVEGDRVDGHDYTDQAREAGAVAAMSSRPVPGPHLIVADPVHALGDLAHHLLRRLPEATVIAVTGSSGKTTTKDLLAAILPERGDVVAPQGSFNTEVGLPLTVLRAGPETATLVLEMGARGVGHIAYLCRIARPRVAVVLNVGSAHVGEFGDRATIARAKSEILAALPPGGVAVVNGDDPLVDAMAVPSGARRMTFGTRPDADVRIVDLVLDDSVRPRFELVHRSQRVGVRMRLSGEHNAHNAAAAATAAIAVGLPLDVVAARLSHATNRSPHRMDISRTPSGLTVVNDAYNANPESMAGALKSLVAMARARGSRSWAVLGPMRELGEQSVEEHDRVGRLAVRLDVSRLLAVGPDARGIQLGAGHEGSWGNEAQWVPDVAAAVQVLVREARPGDVVLVKASRAERLERVVDGLMADPSSPDSRSGAALSGDGEPAP